MFFLHFRHEKGKHAEIGCQGAHTSQNRRKKQPRSVTLSELYDQVTSIKLKIPLKLRTLLKEASKSMCIGHLCDDTHNDAQL